MHRHFGNSGTVHMCRQCPRELKWPWTLMIKVHRTILPTHCCPFNPCEWTMESTFCTWHAPLHRPNHSLQPKHHHLSSNSSSNGWYWFFWKQDSTLILLVQLGHGDASHPSLFHGSDLMDQNRWNCLLTPSHVFKTLMKVAWTVHVLMTTWQGCYSERTYLFCVSRSKAIQSWQMWRQLLRKMYTFNLDIVASRRNITRAL